MTSCSALARRDRAWMLGTASRVDALLLVELPKPWAGKIARTSTFPAGLVEVSARLEARLGSEARLTMLATPPSGAGPEPELRLYRRSPSGEVTAARAPLSAALAPPGGSGAGLLSLFGETRPCPPTLLVCTHGTRDRCCGTLGVPLARALRAQAGDRLEVLECSHLGGHRFAPTAMALPSWRLYGHLEDSDLPRLVEAVTRGRVLAGRHRGACWLTPAAQIAEGIPWEHPDRAMERVEVVQVQLQGDLLEAEVEVHARDGARLPYRMKLARREVRGVASCADLPEEKEKAFPSYHLLELSRLEGR